MANSLRQGRQFIPTLVLSDLWASPLVKEHVAIVANSENVLTIVTSIDFGNDALQGIVQRIDAVLGEVCKVVRIDAIYSKASVDEAKNDEVIAGEEEVKSI